jgi:hypothetical protein
MQSLSFLLNRRKSFGTKLLPLIFSTANSKDLTTLSFEKRERGAMRRKRACVHRMGRA